MNWLYSDEGWRLVSTAVIPFLAIVVAGLVAALIGRGTARRIIAMADRERRIATVTALISAARRASKWNTLSVPEQQHAEHLMHEADTRIRLLTLPGSAMVADWAAHEINQMKSNAVSFSFQAEQSLIDFRNRLVEWQARPSRAKKLFKSDLETWAYESSVADQELVTKQQDWAKRQLDESTQAASATAVSPAQAPALQPRSAPSADAPAVSATAKPGDSSISAPESSDQALPVPHYEVPARLSERPVTAEPDAAAAPEESVVSDDGAPSALNQSPTNGRSVDEGHRSSSPQAAPQAAESDDVPGPVSAGTVRQRINPETPEY